MNFKNIKVNNICFKTIKPEYIRFWNINYDYV